MRQLFVSFIGLALVQSVFVGQAMAGPQGTTLIGEKTASAIVTEVNRYRWAIEKTGPSEMTSIPQGQTATLQFTIQVTRTGPELSLSNGDITSHVCVTNSGSTATQGLYAVDQLEQYG